MGRVLQYHQIKHYWLSTGWGCGLLKVDIGTGRVISGGAPIFTRFVGQDFGELMRGGKYRAKLLRKGDGPDIP